MRAGAVARSFDDTRIIGTYPRRLEGSRVIFTSRSSGGRAGTVRDTVTWEVRVHVADEIRYPADPQTVFEMLCDREFQERKCRATGALEYSVDVVRHGDGSATITTRRTMPTDSFPDFVRSFVGESVQLVEVDTWQPAADDGTRAGTLSVEIAGTPVQMSASLLLAPEGGERRPGTVQHVDGELKVKVPLVGGKIEKAAEPAIRMAIRTEARVGQDWLGG